MYLSVGFSPFPFASPLLPCTPRRTSKATAFQIEVARRQASSRRHFHHHLGAVFGVRHISCLLRWVAEIDRAFSVTATALLTRLQLLMHMRLAPPPATIVVSPRGIVPVFAPLQQPVWRRRENRLLKIANICILAAASESFSCGRVRQLH